MNNAPELSEKLYKYRTFDNLGRYKSLIKNNEFFFASPDTFNDPFDCGANVSLSETGENNAINFLCTEYIKKYPNIPLKRLNEIIPFGVKHVTNNKIAMSQLFKMSSLENGIFSMCMQHNNILMWSHYSNCHTGFCIELNVNVILSMVHDYLQTNDKILTLGKVEYALDYPIVNDILNYNEVFKPLFLKHKNWNYEEEWRMIYNHSNKKICFPDNIIDAIYFGLECPKENIDEAWELVKDKDVKPIFYKAHKSISQFALEFRELKQYREH